MLHRQKNRRSVLQACELGNKLKNAKNKKGCTKSNDKSRKRGERMKTQKKEETKLKKILRDRGIKQQFVADKMGVNVRRINDYANGRTLI